MFASVVELEGNVDDRARRSRFTLKMDGKSVGAPLKMQPFQGAAEPLDLVLVVESSALYGPKKIVAPPPPPPPPPKGKHEQAAKGKRRRRGQKGNKLATGRSTSRSRPRGDEPLDKVKDAVHALLEALSPRVRVLLIDYGGDMTPHPPFRPARRARADLDDLLPDGDAGDLALSQRHRRARSCELDKPRARRQAGAPPHRRRLRRAELADGSQDLQDARRRRRRRRTCRSTRSRSRRRTNAARCSIWARSPSGRTARSAGRETADDLRAQIETLADELNKQYVLTYKIDARSLEGHSASSCRAKS